jgi:hypothetical protein
MKQSGLGAIVSSTAGSTPHKVHLADLVVLYRLFIIWLIKISFCQSFAMIFKNIVRQQVINYGGKTTQRSDGRVVIRNHNIEVVFHSEYKFSQCKGIKAFVSH